MQQYIGGKPRDIDGFLVQCTTCATLLFTISYLHCEYQLRMDGYNVCYTLVHSLLPAL
jgi:hypothetical protein